MNVFNLHGESKILFISPDEVQVVSGGSVNARIQPAVYNTKIRNNESAVTVTSSAPRSKTRVTNRLEHITIQSPNNNTKIW